MHRHNTGKADQGRVKIVRCTIHMYYDTIHMYYDCYRLGCDAVYSSINVHSFLRNLLSVLRVEEGGQLFVSIKVQEASSLKRW